MPCGVCVFFFFFFLIFFLTGDEVFPLAVSFAKAAGKMPCTLQVFFWHSALSIENLLRLDTSQFNEIGMKSDSGVCADASLLFFLFLFLQVTMFTLRAPPQESRGTKPGWSALLSWQPTLATAL